ncbi:MAG: TIGR03984 family CRISPR-associated protein [Symploca sp. SIO3E6]|nr:TIGR03984 family CRISPR-associated protein [Caldora sp. SIO3E6]
MNKPECDQLDFKEDPDKLKPWLEAQAEKYKLRYLLAHAEDGVVWGRFDDGKLTTPDEYDIHLPKLRLLTLQQCRLFGKNAEVMLWKVGQNWRARAIKDQALSKEDYLCENQILWGTKPKTELKNGFTLVSDGSQGLRHAVPLTNIPFQGQDYRPLRLKVRHYLDYDESGVARINLSRLVNLDFD